MLKLKYNSTFILKEMSNFYLTLFKNSIKIARANTFIKSHRYDKIFLIQLNDSNINTKIIIFLKK